MPIGNGYITIEGLIQIALSIIKTGLIIWLVIWFVKTMNRIKKSITRIEEKLIDNNIKIIENESLSIQQMNKD